MGIFYGGIAQILPVCWSTKGNTFGLTAFTSYGSFWLTLVAILLMPKLGLTDAPNAQFLGVSRVCGAYLRCLCSSAR